MAQQAAGYGEQIRLARRSKGWTQEQLARKVRVGLMTVSRWERGLWTPNPQAMKRLEHALGIELVDDGPIICPTCGAAS